MIPNKATVDLVKRFEGLRLTAYKDPVGVPTIGYGLTTGALPGVTVKIGMTISEAKAEEYLTMVLERFGATILPMMRRQPSRNQYGAMLSLAYNIGTGAFAKSTCLRRFNAGDDAGAAEALTWFNKAGGRVLPGLVRRRAAERELFLADDLTQIETPTPDAERGASKSTTLIAAGASAASGAAGVFTALGSLDGRAQQIVIGAAFVAALGIAWIARERLRKWADGDR